MRRLKQKRRQTTRVGDKKHAFLSCHPLKARLNARHSNPQAGFGFVRGDIPDSPPVVPNPWDHSSPPRRKPEKEN